jgi:hypothetical protein
VSPEEMQSLAQQIALTLGETERKPIAQIQVIIEKCGIEFAQAMLAETLAVEAQGGMMLPDQSRRRTTGGIFFHLCRRKMPNEIARAIFSSYYSGRYNSKGKKKAPKAEPSVLPPLNWEERAAVIQPLLDEKGALTTVKVTLIGRPGQIDTSRKDVVITTMSHIARSATFPKGVPKPPEKPTLYTVYISAKQWQKVKDSITDPEDALIIEGTCAYDEEIGGMAVFVMNLTSKLLEGKKRQAQKEGDGASETATDGAAIAKQPSNPRPAPQAAPQKSKAQKDFDSPAPKSSPAVPDLPNAPHDVTQKLTELYASASLFRQKIATIQSKPPGQQFGLEMTQKLLKNVEDEIAAIEKKYHA